MTRGHALVLATALTAACGLKTAPVAPELVEPTAPQTIRATPAATGVEIVWRRPTRYSGGAPMRDIERFVIERTDGSRPTWTAVGDVVMTDRYRLQQPRRIDWLDTGAVPGVRYQYRVITITRDGRQSPPSPPTAVRHRIVAPEAVAGDDPS